VTTNAAEPALEAQWTVGQILDWTTAHFRKLGSESPRLEAEILLAHARNCPRIQLYVDYTDQVAQLHRARMRELVRRRGLHEPVAYLVGQREFLGLAFALEGQVLIPRPETETLVLELLSLAKTRTAPRILDVGTGSGCIAVAAAVNLPHALFVASDVSEQALRVARQNAQRHGVADRIRFVRGSLFEPLSPGERFDFVVSNPPYVAQRQFDRLPPDVRLHEPRSALVAGDDGLECIRGLLQGAADWLAPGGSLIFEIDPEQVSAVTRLAEQQPCFGPPRVVHDLSREARVVCCACSAPP
jgi:release factor glutamine methyltransferase